MTWTPSWIYFKDFIGTIKDSSQATQYFCLIIEMKIKDLKFKQNVSLTACS